MVFNWERGHGGCWSWGIREGESLVSPLRAHHYRCSESQPNGLQPECCSVAQVGNHCLSFSYLATVCHCPQICSNASCFALGTDLRGIRSIVFFLAMALQKLLSPPGAEVEARPQPPQKCNSHLPWKTALMIALLRTAKRASTRRHGPEGQLRARVQCSWQRPQPGVPPFSAVRKTHHCDFFVSWSASVSKCESLRMQVFRSATVSKCIRFSLLHRKLKLRVICRSSIILGCVFIFCILWLCC